MKKETKKTKDWKHVGGGCWLGDKTKYPCDDMYEHVKTKKTFTVFSTKEEHFNMPSSVSSINDLLKRGLVVRKQK
ncbi:MAG TPA: hypothetical protein VN026_11475 [Bacteroidia bacterium]|jgi:hypothetical protein|nr:hypothetical protein [Bacteroidia bacterium]